MLSVQQIISFEPPEQTGAKESLGWSILGSLTGVSVLTFAGFLKEFGSGYSLLFYFTAVIGGAMIIVVIVSAVLWLPLKLAVTFAKRGGFVSQWIYISVGLLAGILTGLIFNVATGFAPTYFLYLAAFSLSGAFAGRASSNTLWSKI